MSQNWRDRANVTFDCEKQPATGSRGMVTANNPLGAMAGAEMLAAGGNAVDAAVATLFTLTVVEPMMVGFSGGGIFNIRTPDGEHVIIDNQSKAPLAATPDMYVPVADTPDRRLETVGRKNTAGPLAMATPGALAGWADALARFGTFSLADVLEPAIRHASRGFRATSYLAECTDEAKDDLATCPHMRALYLPDGAPLKAGHLVVQSEYAETLRTIAQEGVGAFYDGAIGLALTDHMTRVGGIVSAADLADCKPPALSLRRASRRALLSPIAFSSAVLAAEMSSTSAVERWMSDSDRRWVFSSSVESKKAVLSPIEESRKFVRSVRVASRNFVRSLSVVSR